MISIFLGTLIILCVIAFLISHQVKTSSSVVKNNYFIKLQNQYLLVYCLATFADWLQGPYIYKLYRDYGYDDDTISKLYLTGFASSCLFGLIVGHAADKYGRKFVCILFGILYVFSCMTKVSSQFNVLFIGRIIEGISTSVLFSTFEAWYVNEHLNYFKFPPEWLNITFSKAAFYTGLLAIISGIVSQFLVETLQFGSKFPFIFAIPFIIISVYFIIYKWDEHPQNEDDVDDKSVLIFSAIKLIFCKDTTLLLLCLIQSLYESVMHIFIISWTPILSIINPPLGLIFSAFMVAFMIGTKIYALLMSKHYRPQNLLIFTCAVGLVSYSSIAVMTSSSLFIKDQGNNFLTNSTIFVFICFFSFVIYEMSVGLYYPAVGYLRGRVIPEEYRATVTNLFKVPMNIFTCLGFSIKQKYLHVNNNLVMSPSHMFNHQQKFPVIFIICSLFLLITTFICTIFSKKYTSKFTKTDKEIEYENTDVNNKNLSNLETVKKIVTI